MDMLIFKVNKIVKLFAIIAVRSVSFQKIKILV